MNGEKRLTEVLACRHCGNSAPMKIVALYYGPTRQGDAAFPVDYREDYELCLCPACSQISLRVRDVYADYPYTVGSVQILYPAAEHVSLPRGIPECVRKAFETAAAVRAKDANAYAVLLGRVLEAVCLDRVAAGSGLFEQLEDLCKRREFPEQLGAVAHGLRRLRNVGAHGALGELTADDVPVLDKLTLAILDYVYGAPALVREAAERLERQKGGAAAHGRERDSRT